MMFWLTFWLWIASWGALAQFALGRRRLLTTAAAAAALSLLLALIVIAEGPP